MTKKNYEAFAKMLREMADDGYDLTAVSGMAARMAIVFKDDNPRFNVRSFLEAADLIRPNGSSGRISPAGARWLSDQVARQVRGG